MSIKRKLDKLEEEAAEQLLATLGNELLMSENETMQRLRRKLPKKVVRELEEQAHKRQQWFANVNRHIFGDDSDSPF